MKFFITLFLAITFINSYGQQSLIGHWRRINPDSKILNLENKKEQFGDLIIYSDSTFYMPGDSSALASKKPGWHSGDEYRGTWTQPESQQLNLWLELRKIKAPLPFVIIELTQENLVLMFSYEKNKSKSFYITYRRI